MIDRNERLGFFSCPGCSTGLRYSKRINVSRVLIWHESQNETIDTKEPLEDFFKSTRFSCPCCGKILQFKLDIRIVGVDVIDPSSDTQVVKNSASALFKDWETKIIIEAKKNGLLEAFWTVVQATRTSKNQATLHDKDRFFINFLKTVYYDKKVDPRLLAKSIGTMYNPSQKLEFWRANSIGMVICNDAIWRFVLVRSLKQHGTKSLIIGGIEVDRTLESVNGLLKTRLGYVPLEARLFSESLRHSMGDFGRKMRPVNIAH